MTYGRVLSGLKVGLKRYEKIFVPSIGIEAFLVQQPEWTVLNDIVKRLLKVGIGLGSNLGEREAEMDAAVTFLRTIANRQMVLEGPRIETSPVDCPPDSPPFLNSVVEMNLDPRSLSPAKLLAKLQAFEQSRGRPSDRQINAPRPIDLDILYFGDLVVKKRDLVIPHPRAHLRRFVLEPLAEISPRIVFPGQLKNVQQLLVGLRDPC